MVFKIIWSALSLKTYISNIEYLEKEWTSKEVKNFISTVQRKIAILSLQPKSGRLTSQRMNVRQVVIHKRIILIYRFKPQKKELELVRFFNTRQHPKRLRKQNTLNPSMINYTFSPDYKLNTKNLVFSADRINKNLGVKI